MEAVDLNLVIAGLFGIIILYMLIKLLVYPFRAIARILLQLSTGVLVLVIFNLAMSYWGVSIGVNPATGLLVGILGPPGFITLMLLQIII